MKTARNDECRYCYQPLDGAPWEPMGKHQVPYHVHCSREAERVLAEHERRSRERRAKEAPPSLPPGSYSLDWRYARTGPGFIVYSPPVVDREAP